MEKNIKLFLGLLIAFILLILTLWLAPVPASVTGMLHPDYSTMLKSGDSVASSPTTKWLAYFFGLGIMGIFAFCLFIGANKKDQQIQQKLRKVFILGFLAYVLVYTFMVFSYWNYHEANTSTYFLGFPTPTAWMIYGMWFIPIIFSIVYIFKFNDWVLTAEELEQFQKIVRARRKREEKQEAH